MMHETSDFFSSFQLPRRADLRLISANVLKVASY
jgi:hypothetical protein